MSKKQTFRRFGAVLLAIIVVNLLLAPLPAFPSHSLQLSEGYPAPPFVLPDLDDKPVELTRARDGKRVTLIMIWGVWCPYCRAIMVMLKKIYREQRHKGLEILAVSIRESAFKVSIFIDQLKPGFPVLIDEWGELKDPYKVKDVPRIVILDQNGLVTYTAITTSAQKIETAIQSALKP